MSKVTVGRFGAAHGVHGWLKVISFTVPAENILHYSPWFILTKKQWQTVQILDSKLQNGQVLVKIMGCDSREEVRKYTNIEIFTPRSELPSLAKDEFYWADLEGLAIRTSNNVELGTVDHLFASGANDILVVKGDRQRLIPYIKDVIKKVDLVERVIIVDWDPDF